MLAIKAGLSQVEAGAALQIYGYNEFESQKIKTAFANILKVILDPMGLMLLILSAVYWFLGERSDAIILMIAYIPIVGVDVFLDLRSQTALRALSRTLKSTCTVVRDGKMSSIPIRNLVPGDALVLEEGQTIPADGLISEASNLTIDESSATGESVPVEKATGAQVLSGTTIVSGSGIVEIQKTGLSSQIGSIAKVLMQFESTGSPLLRLIRKIVGFVSLGAVVIGAIVLLVDMLRGRGFAPSLISSLTLAMAAIPEEFAVVFTLYLSLAAFRLSRKGVLVKSLPSVEGLGRVDIICLDKTGTLTEGKFKLEKIIDRNGEIEFDEAASTALIFACEPKPVDAMETSIFNWIREKRSAIFIEAVHKKWSLKYDNAFSLQEKYMSHVWTSSDQDVLAMKGALESVLEHCSLNDSDKKTVIDFANVEASAGRRILGFASKRGQFSGVRDKDEAGLNFLGILCFTDPVRPSAKGALRLCEEEGVKVKILTGDHMLTAKAVADEVQISYSAHQLFTGFDIENFSASQKEIAFETGVIFARLKPEQKLELVAALKSKGHVVAMTGDGINDAPALKLADVGISMGERATDVARSTAQLILLKNDFGGVVDSIRAGRRVMNSLGESFGYLIAFHIPIISLGLYQSFFMSAPILLPIHIVLMQLIVHPVSAFVFDEASSESGQRRKQFITKRAAAWSIVRGLLLTGFALGVFYLSVGSEASRRSLTLLVLIAGNIGLLFAEVGGVAKAGRHPITYRRTWVAALALISLSVSLTFIDALSKIFVLHEPEFYQLLLAVGLGASLGLVTNYRSLSAC